MQKVRRHSFLLRLLVSIQFQVYFTPLLGVLFTFPSLYLFTIGHKGVLRLGGWSPHLQTGFHVSRFTHNDLSSFRVRGYHPSCRAFQLFSTCSFKSFWPGPLSLTTTYGVSFDFLSSGYLDVSVPQVCLINL